MKRLTLSPIAAALVLTSTVNLAHAANVEVQWQDPAKFSDMRASNESQSRFEQRTMNTLTGFFQEEAAKLPEGQTLRITVNNVDLAGEVEYFHRAHPFGVRVVRRVYSPSMTLSYELLDANKAVVSAGDARLRDVGFDLSTLHSLNRGPLLYEGRLVKDWMRKTFESTAS